VGVLCNAQPDPNSPGVNLPPRFKEGIDLCTFVERELFRGQTKPYALSKHIPITLVHRVLNLFYAKGNLELATGRQLEAKADYESGLECVLSTFSDPRQYAGPHGSTAPLPPATVTDLLLGSILAGLSLMALQYSESSQAAGLRNLMHNLGFRDGPPPMDYFQLARIYRPSILPFLHELGGSLLPQILLTPQDVKMLPALLFRDTNGLLPTVQFALRPANDGDAATGDRSAVSIGQVTSTLLLTLAKVYQDAIAQPQNPIALALMAQGMPPHTSLVLPLYYLAIAIHPSPSTFNNLGILLSTLPASTVVSTPQGPRSMSGQALAMEFYKAGLEIDPKHPHLYTNLGSLLKDMGHLGMAVQMYEKAVEFNPHFDVALANLANAIKDMGHVQESVVWYKRAVEVNANFPEAICGLVNALSGVCDWKGRGGMLGEMGVGSKNELLDPTNAEDRQQMLAGYMPRVVELVAKQLAEGQQFGAHIVQLSGGVDAWMRTIVAALGPGASSEQLACWRSRLQAFMPIEGSASLLPPSVNEGGWLIRAIEYLMRQVQRRWYIDAFGKTVKASTPQAAIVPQPSDGIRYPRPLLPANLPLPPVPTVLPFHTFTYPLSARQTRLICHRNALRISYQALNQPWLAGHVFPPPPPPAPKLRIGYVSSDFNNHPLAHLMQSVFGMHDLGRFEITCYATTPSDGSVYRTKIQQEAQHFIDVSAWNIPQTINKIIEDGIHILVNLNGYTKGARNEIFAARPCPIQIQQLMGFAGTLGAGWADWVIADEVIVPSSTVSSELSRDRREAGQAPSLSDFPGSIDPEEDTDDWMYTEKMAYFPSTYFITDHRQGFRDEVQAQKLAKDRATAWKLDEQRRWDMRHQLFPQLADDVVIFCCLNQLYKVREMRVAYSALTIGLDRSLRLPPMASHPGEGSKVCTVAFAIPGTGRGAPQGYCTTLGRRRDSCSYPVYRRGPGRQQIPCNVRLTRINAETNAYLSRASCRPLSRLHRGGRAHDFRRVSLFCAWVNVSSELA
jgi:protein O-GlcNAc transferase